MTEMKALTVWQPWASLIAEGAKPYEFRRWDYRTRYPCLVDTRIVVHAGLRPVRKTEVKELHLRISWKETDLVADRALDVLRKSNDGRDLLLGHGLGTAILRAPKRATELYGDSDRIDHEIWAWPLTDWEAFVPPVPMRGLQGFWTWPT